MERRLSIQVIASLIKNIQSGNLRQRERKMEEGGENDNETDGSNYPESSCHNQAINVTFSRLSSSYCEILDFDLP